MLWVPECWNVTSFIAVLLTVSDPGNLRAKILCHAKNVEQPGFPWIGLNELLLRRADRNRIQPRDIIRKAQIVRQSSISYALGDGALSGCCVGFGIYRTLPTIKKILRYFNIKLIENAVYGLIDQVVNGTRSMIEGRHWR